MCIRDRLEVVQEVGFDALQTGLCRAEVVGFNAERAILGLNEAVVAAGKLILQHTEMCIRDSCTSSASVGDMTRPMFNVRPYVREKYRLSLIHILCIYKLRRHTLHLIGKSVFTGNCKALFQRRRYPVSYTHLDVYKRQAHSALISAKDSAVASTSSQERTGDFEAVSYTHLDVYKRQMESRLIGIEAKDIRASFQSAQNIAT